MGRGLGLGRVGTLVSILYLVALVDRSGSRACHMVYKLIQKKKKKEKSTQVSRCPMHCQSANWSQLAEVTGAHTMKNASQLSEHAQDKHNICCIERQRCGEYPISHRIIHHDAVSPIDSCDL